MLEWKLLNGRRQSLIGKGSLSLAKVSKSLSVEPVMQREDVLAILEAADSLVSRAGRSMLVKVLKGSREKKLLELGLNCCDAYGYYADRHKDEVLERVDWMIKNDYLSIGYSGDMPLLYFTDYGWIVQREQGVNRLLSEWTDWVDHQVPVLSMSHMKDKNREMILMFLEKVAETQDARFIPLLEKWQPIDYKKVRQAIGQVIAYLKDPKGTLELEGSPHPMMRTADIVLTRSSERLKCWDCGDRFEWSISEQDSFRMQGWDPPKRCPECREEKQRRRLEMGDFSDF
ncbi:RQC-minor-1 family DNA-binding protein [Paenibacillus koleovorans]|uniref:RQC-minor-1 family DNA-binding protein n=1 Tax=Paenibacillus koleovorans TaxID=121608 RepID=UPI000FD9BD71|nr:RQC-minor-1 family DNA-binding protein [Paenibacillus koleovorans]